MESQTIKNGEQTTEVNRLEQEKQRDYDDTFRKAVENEHTIKKECNLVIEQLKQILQATAGKIRRYNNRKYYFSKIEYLKTGSKDFTKIKR